jgi:plastocyanin
VVGSTDDEYGEDSMKRYGKGLGVLVTAVVLASTPVLAHEDCDDVDQAKTAMAERGDGEEAQTPGTANVTIKLFQYQPGRIQVKAGTTVTWLNEDEIFHTVTAVAEEGKSGGFDASLDGKGKSFSFTFSQPGVYSYYCDRHEHMRGEIEVR